MRYVIHILLALLILIPVMASAQQMENPDLSDLLLKLAENDRMYREEIAKLQSQSGFHHREIQKLMEDQRAADEENQQLLDAIVNQHGWPDKSIVGEEALNSAFMVVQHAGVSYQKHYLPMLKEAARKRDLPPENVAVLEDKMRMRDNLPQLYGTQLRVEESDGKEHLYPIEDPAEVNERRAEMGLPPIEEMLEEKGIDWRPPGSEVAVETSPPEEEVIPTPPPLPLETIPADTSVVQPDTSKARNW